MKGFILKTPGRRAATPGRLRGGRTPRLEHECPPTPRQARDAVVHMDFANRGVRTVLAIKPLEAETGATQAQFPALIYNSTAKALITTAPPDQAPGDSCPEHSFDSRYFDQVYQGQTIRADLKKELQPIVDRVVEGRSAAVVAYGQTGSGKTFLMEGEPSMNDRGQWGLAPYAVYRVLQTVQKSTGKKFLVSLSFLEIYNETVRDLLDARPLKKGEQSPSLQLKLNADGYFDIPEATSTPVSDTVQALALIQAGSARRVCAATGMNARSSRSFADVMLTVESIDEATGDVGSCRLHLVDLAGSERQAQTHAEGARLKESSSINLALLALRKVVHARSALQATPAPYTNSKVTKVLKDALAGESALLIVCCLSASPVNYQDSLSTLKFAASCRSLTAKPTVRRVSNSQSRIKGLSVAVERVRADEKAALAERMIRLESRAVAKDLELQVAEAQLLEARDQLQAGANLALAAQAACEELLLRGANVIDELVTSQPDSSETTAGLLASHVLPQLDFCLSNPQMTAHVESRALLRLFKSLLQVNLAANHSAVLPLASLFDRLLTVGRPKGLHPDGSGLPHLLFKAWPGLLTFCGKLLLADVGAPKLPPFVLDNIEKALCAILKALQSEEVKRVAGPEGNRPEIREALEVAGQVVDILKECRFSRVFREILRRSLPFQREALLDLASPLGLGQPSSPGNWLTPSKARGKSSRSSGESYAERPLEGGAVVAEQLSREEDIDKAKRDGSRKLQFTTEDSEKSLKTKREDRLWKEVKSPEDCFSLEEPDGEECPGSWLTPRALNRRVGRSRVSNVRSPAVKLQKEERKGETDVWGDTKSGDRECLQGEQKSTDLERSERDTVAQVCNEEKQGSVGSDVLGVRTGADRSIAATQKYPRALITGEWHTPEYMKPKQTVSRKVKTCERGTLGLRTPGESASKSMESVKKVLFAEGATRGSIEASDWTGPNEKEGSAKAAQFRTGSESMKDVRPIRDELKLPIWKGSTTRQVLSPLKIGAPNAGPPPVLRTPTAFCARLGGKENVPATDVPKLPQTSGYLTTSAKKPPRAVLDTCQPEKIAASTGEASRTGIAQLRSHLDSLMLQDSKQAHAQKAKMEVAADYKVCKHDTTGLTTPLGLPKKGATTYLSPALLWTPSRGPSPSLDNLRERLAGMSRK